MADSPELEEAQKEEVRQSVELLHGPEQVDHEKDELIVLAQVRNSRQYVRAFVEHYLALGAKHLIFLDNGSNDGTVETLKEYENVTVLRTLLPYRTHNVAMKQYLLEHFGKGRWSLLVDIDELFDYPFSDLVGLGSLLDYLNERSYTAVVAHMLDMFSEEPIRKDAPAVEDDPLKEKYRFYDVSDVYSQSYRLAEDAGNAVSNEDVEILRGGVRQTIFGNKANLIKHPLIFYDDEIRPMDLSDHWVGNARIADFTGVLLHYKLSDRLYEDVRSSVAEKNRSDNGTRRYSSFLEVLQENPELRIKRETSKELHSTDELISDGFVVVSNQYMDFVKPETQDSLQKLQNILRVETAKVGQVERKNERSEERNRNLEERNGELAEQKENLREKNGRLAEQKENLRESNGRLTEQKKNLQERNQDMKSKNESLRREQKQSSERERELKGELHKVRQQSNDLSASLNRIRSSRSWRLLDGLNRIKISGLSRIRKILTRRG